MTSALAHLETYRCPYPDGPAQHLRMYCLLPRCSWRDHVNRSDYIGWAEYAELLAAAKSRTSKLQLQTSSIERSEDEMRTRAIEQVRIHLHFVHGIHGAIAIEAEAFVLAAGEGSRRVEESKSQRVEE